jgi:hypothetical protein
MKRHAIAVTEEEWQRAQRIGQLQSVPVSASTLLRVALNLGLEQKERELKNVSRKRETA